MSIKLAYITTVPLTQWWFLYGQNQYMSSRGFELHAIASPGDLLTKLSARDPVAVHEVMMSRKMAPLADVIALIRLFNLLRRIRPEIAHVSTPKAALLGAIAAWAAQVPVRLFLFRGSLTEGATGLRKALFWSLEWLTVRLCHQTVCVSPSLLQYARATRILSDDQGIVIANGMSNGVDVRRFELTTSLALSKLPPRLAAALINKQIVVIGYIGRMAQDKGIEELVRAWQTIRDSFPQTILVLVGPLAGETGISEQAMLTLDSDPRVYRIDFTDDVVSYYQVMSLFVYPSYREGFPNSPMEAAAMGLPVIATDVVGCRDAVQDGITGTIVPPHDSDALAAAIKMYLDDPALRQRHGQAGRERVLRDYRPEAIWEGLYQEYLQLLQTRKLPLPEPEA